MRGASARRRGRRALAGGAAVLAVLGATAATLLVRSDDRPSPPRTSRGAVARAPARPDGRPAASSPGGAVAQPPTAGHHPNPSHGGVRAPPRIDVPAGPLAARIVRRTQLRTSPGGRVVRAIGTSTGYGSARVLAVVARRGAWLGVLSDHMPNSRAAWMPASGAELVPERYRLDADLAARLLTVRRDGRVVRRIKIAIGGPATPTPTGRFAVTDALRIGPDQPEYGCCALALTGRQRHLPRGWSTSDRLAIHGTPGDAAIGDAVTNGCLHARRTDMRWLLRRITPGTPLRIRAGPARRPSRTARR